MVKVKRQFVCQNCGASYPKWTGRCENCGEWNTLLEQEVESGTSAVAKASSSGKALAPQRLAQIGEGKRSERLKTGFGELDEVLGGGIVAGAVVLLAGQPGIGKSTLLLQVAAQIADGLNVLYVTGEESAEQLKLRAERLGVGASSHLEIAATTRANDVAPTLREGGFQLVVIDSIQTMSLDEVTSAPGTVSQITNSANVIIRAAKDSNTAVIVVGHVTKEGSIAGPKVLEHLVDVVLQFEGDRYGGFKMVRASKNRYGSTAEIALFQMGEKGLEAVKNPSAELLSERQNVDGSVILATMEGARPLLVEIQALVQTTSFGYPKRTASGFDLNRLNLLVAVLERRTKLKLSDKDIYINVVGGLKLTEPAADLAICVAIASAAAQRKLDDDIVVFGEVGLGGEIRSVPQSDRRVAEAKKLGFKKAIGPVSGTTHTKSSFIQPVKDLRQALIDYLS